MIDRELGHYRVVGLLGIGGMGEVYRAVDTRLGREVALKVLPVAVGSDPDRLRRFHQEARSLAALSHPNIVTVYSVEEQDGVHFLTMELVAGRTLAEVIPAHGLALSKLLEIAVGLADALAAAHAAGIVHRDLKPGNVMLAADGRPKVLDFGLAAWRPPAEPAAESALPTVGLTAGIAPVGTAPYMSPEQIEGRPVDARSDIFSLGVVLFEMAVGCRPFAGDSFAAVTSAILRDTPPAVTTLRTDLPPRLARIIERCLVKEARARYQSVVDLRHDLAELLEDTVRRPAQPGPGQVGEPRRAGDPHRWRRRAFAVALAVTVLTAAVVLLRGGPVGTEAPIRSVAVLPFDNLMRDPAQDYLVDGMHETLITTLAKVRQLRVISRTSVMRYRDGDKGIPEIASELGVDAVIEGSVLRTGNRVRITAQLIRGVRDEHLWANEYDRDVTAVLPLLSEVATAIAGEVCDTLSPEQRNLLVTSRSAPAEAQEAFLQGRQAAGTFTAAGREKALALQRKAVALAPDFAEAWSELGATELVRGIFDDVDAAVARQAAEEAATRALTLDSTLARPYGTIGYIRLYFDHDWPSADEYLQRAIELDPTDAVVRHGYADLLLVEGRIEESLAQVEQGLLYDPLGPIANAVVAGHTYFARRYEALLQRADRLAAQFPQLAGTATSYRFKALWGLNRRGEALQALRQGWAVRSPMLVAALDRGEASGGPRGALEAVADVLSQQVTAGSDALWIAGYYALGGDTERALDMLDVALAQREPFILHIKADPSFDALRSEPRYLELVRRIGFPS